MDRKFSEAIVDMLEEAEELLEKAKKGLLKVEVRDNYEDKFLEIVSNNRDFLDEISSLEFQRDFEGPQNRWHKQGEVFLRKEKALSSINPRKDFLERVLERNSLDRCVDNKYFSPNQPYTARKYLNTLLKNVNKITFVDKYFNPEVLNYLSELFTQGDNPKVEILRGSPVNKSDKKKISRLRTDTVNLNKEFNNPVKSIMIIPDLPLHDRYLVVDEDIFHFGNSFHSFLLSDKASEVNSVKDKVAIKKIQNDINAWRQEGRKLI